MGRIAIPVANVLIVSATHVLGIITSFDWCWSIPTARSFLREGNTDLDEYAALLEAQTPERSAGPPGERYPVAVERQRARSKHMISVDYYTRHP